MAREGTTTRKLGVSGVCGEVKSSGALEAQQSCRACDDNDYVYEGENER